MPLDEIDLRRGSVLHIKDFSTRGHQKKNKYLLVLGRLTDSEILGFLISSQLAYLRQESHRNEVIRIPQNVTAFLPVESIIQCFELEYLLVEALGQAFDEGLIVNMGLLPVKYVH